MACQLSPDPTFTFDFLTTTGAQITILVTSTTPTAIVHLVSAFLNSTKLTVANDQAVFTAVASRNDLSLAFFSSDPSATYEVREDCGGGSSRLLFAGNFLSQPTKGFRIHAF